MQSKLSSAQRRQGAAFPAQPGSVGNLSLALFHDWSPDRIYVLITVYIDESGTHGAPLMTMGGLVGRLGQWVTFDAKWRRMLHEKQIDHFHLKKMKHSQGPFKGWSRRAKDEMMRHVDRIIHRHTLFAFTIMLRDDEYVEHYHSGERPKKARLDSRYGLCFRLCLSVVPDMLRSAFPDDEIDLHFVLEAGHKNFGDAKRVFDEIKDKGPPHIAGMLRTLTSGDKKEFPGLQGADVPAHISFDYESRDEPPIEGLGGKTAVEIIRDKSDLKRATIFRQHITPDVLQSARKNVLDEVAKRAEFGKRRAMQKT